MALGTFIVPDAHKPCPTVVTTKPSRGLVTSEGHRVSRNMAKWQFSESFLGSHHSISPQLIKIPLQGKLLLIPKTGGESHYSTCIQKKDFFASISTCVFKRIAFSPLETEFSIHTAHPEDVSGFMNMHIQYISSKTYKEKRTFQESNPAFVLLSHLDFYCNSRELAKGNFMVCLSILPSKPGIKK